MNSTHDGVGFCVNDIVKLLGPTVNRIRGTGEGRFSNVNELKNCNSESITFCRLVGDEARKALGSCEAAVVITHQLDFDPIRGRIFIEVGNPRLAFIKIVNEFFRPARPSGIHPRAIIHPDAIIASSVYVGANAVIGKCSVGENSVIYENVVLYDNVKIGANVVVNAGTVVGADGFGYEKQENGEMLKFPHLGGVSIDDDVEIGTNTSIDRGTLGDTRIRRGVKIDNQVHIAHNCDIGEDTVVIAQSMVGGSVKIGPGSWIAPSTTIMNGISLGEGVTCGLGAVVTKGVQAGVTVMGNPARPAEEAKAIINALKNLTS